MTKDFNDANFQVEVIDASKEKPVLVDFFAPWCGPCKMQAPVIDEVAELINDIAIVGKCDTETSSKSAGQYGIMSIPALLIFKDGEVKETMVGMQSKENLIEILKKYV
ncbi:thioredoxin [Candidatus Parcubacteria bacterium]|nr:thioredoxin [Candidatus Parcubacteria bacterium]